MHSGMSQPPPIAPKLFKETADGPRLIGGRCVETGRLVFPLPDGEGFEPVLLSPHGRLWSWTVQRFLPKSPPYAGTETPQTFRPYVVAYVELPGEIIVQSRLEGVDPDALTDPATLTMGQPLALVLVPFETTSGTVTRYAFRPAA
jgi:uncharacterized protein